MLVDGFNDLHGFRASVPDDGEFDGVMGFAVPVLHVSVKECGAALLSLLAQFRQSVEEVEVGQRSWFAIGSSKTVVPCVRVGSLDRALANTEMLRAGPPMLVRTKRSPLSSMSILNLGGIGGL